MTMVELRSRDRWSNDEFLDGLRCMGDVLADQCFHALEEQLKENDFSELFGKLNANDQPIPEDSPEPLRVCDTSGKK